jgi:hypothetical protein
VCQGQPSLRQVLQLAGICLSGFETLAQVEKVLLRYRQDVSHILMLDQEQRRRALTVRKEGALRKDIMREIVERDESVINQLNIRWLTDATEGDSLLLAYFSGRDRLIVHRCRRWTVT